MLNKENKVVIQTTKALKTATRYASDYATKNDHDVVTINHIVLGVLSYQSLGRQFLESLHVPLNDFRAFVESQIEGTKDRNILGFLKTVGRSNNNPTLSKEYIALLDKALSYGNAYGDTVVSTESLLVALFHEEGLAIQKWLLDYSSPQQAMAKLKHLRASSGPVTSEIEREYKYLNEFGINITAMAREGKMDPIIGRDREIREAVQILSQKTKNNPVLVGEPGVGKTAIVEGLAQRIIKGDVPHNLLGRQIVSVDMQSLVSGARYKGDFEERLKGVLSDASSSNGQIILFIDELHTIVGAGGSGSGDASNAIKPALARGEVAILGATTTDEYRQYIEKDGALDRRFQRVNVPEPTLEDAISILRGLREGFERHHHVKVHDNALVAAVQLSDRYIGNRYLPDKAIDIVDQASAEVKVQMNSTPIPIDKVDRQILRLEVELQALSNEHDSLSISKAEKSRIKLNNMRQKSDKMRQRWLSEKKLLEVISQSRAELLDAMNDLEEATSKLDSEKVSHLEQNVVPQMKQNIQVLEERFDKLTQGQPMMQESVTEEQIANVISHRTGIPLNKLLSDDKDKLLHLDKELAKRVIGQEEAVTTVSNTVIRSRVGAQDPNRPLGSFMFLGPSGTGKTELAKALAEMLFDSEDAMVRLDMSEYMEKHSVNRLIGAPPGYVGYEQGGQLTEAVRNQPYSVILFDEVEKAHVEVFDALLQVLDDGRITDGKGQIVDFTNTIIILTSNLGSRDMMQDQHALAGNGYQNHTRDAVNRSVQQHFRPEFINRIDDTVLFNPLGHQVSGMIVDKSLYRFCERMFANQYSIFYTDALVDWIAKAAYDPQYGARPFNRFIQDHIEVPFSKGILSGQVNVGDEVELDVNANNQLKITIAGRMDGYS